MKGYKSFNPGLICRGKKYAENTVIMCSKCGIKSPRFQQKCSSSSDEEAIKAWNRRDESE